MIQELLLSLIVAIVGMMLIVQCDGREHQEWCCARKTLKWRQKTVLTVIFSQSC